MGAGLSWLIKGYFGLVVPKVNDISFFYEVISCLAKAQI